MANCAFIGLGVMGFPMAGHLVSTGHKVNVWNRTQSKAEKWSKTYDGNSFEAIKDCVKDVDFVFLCVGEDNDVYAVMDAVLPNVKAGTIVIDHTTASSKCAQNCYEQAKAKNIGFLDAPISGGEAGAVNGQLSVMCGGDPDIYHKAKPIMDSYAKATTLIGRSGAGQAAKMINQICIAGVLQGLSEGVFFAKKMGLDMEIVLQAIGKGAAQSWQMDNRALTMSRDEFDFGFAVDWMLKDLGIVLQTAQEKDVDLPLVADVQARYATIQEMGGGRWDTSSLIKALK